MTTSVPKAVISRSPREESGQNLALLQEQALAVIQRFAGDSWSDHNQTDPGITLLEVLAFVISDLSYRLGFPIRDLMAWPPEMRGEAGEPFWLAPEVLPSNAVTMADHKRVLLDIPGIRAVELERIEATDRFEVAVDTADEFPVAGNPARLALAGVIRERFLNQRNVNEDIDHIRFIEKHPLTLALDLSFGALADPVATLADIVSKLRAVISPPQQKFTLEQLREQGLSGDDIFDGPLNNHGFVPENQLKPSAFPQTLYASELMAALEGVEGLNAIRRLTFLKQDDSGSSTDEIHWRYQIAADDSNTPIVTQSLSLDIETTLDALTLEIDGQAYSLSEAEKQAIRSELNPPEPYSTASRVVASTVVDLQTYGTGRYRELSRYLSIQQEFPTIYRLAEQRLEGDLHDPELAKIMQLKGFLTLFDQVLADQFAQLETLKTLLATPYQACLFRLGSLFDAMLGSEPLSDQDCEDFWLCVQRLPQTTISQPVTDVSGMKHLLGNYFRQYEQVGFQTIAEPIFSEGQLDRLNRSLGHLLARFAESTPDANLLRYRSVFRFYTPTLQPSAPANTELSDGLLKKLVCLKQVTDKAMLLSDYPRLSRRRAGGFNYINSQPREHFTTSLAHRILRFLGVRDTARLPLATGNREGFYLLESELLWTEESQNGHVPRTLYFILPRWPTRFANSKFRALLERQIVRESPVHQTPVAIYLNREQMSAFERLFYAWLNAMTQRPLAVFNGAEKISPDEHEAGEWLDDLKARLRQFLSNPAEIESLPPFDQGTVGHSYIGDDFRIAYTPLDHLKPNFPIGEARINPTDINDTAFTVNIHHPNRIEEQQ